MTDINRIVFDVYKGVLDMDYSKNSKGGFLSNICKLFRYTVSGYIFTLRYSKFKMNQINKFVPTRNVYNKPKLVVYTVCMGKYDIIKEPIYVDENIDYVIFTDQEVPKESIWQKRNLSTELRTSMTSLAQARYIKTHPHEFFKNYDYSMFIDGNIRITCDIKPLLYSMIDADKMIAIHRHQVRDCVYQEAKAIYAAGKGSLFDILKQIRTYRKEGFPSHYGLFETNIVIRKHNDKECIKIMDDWWNEMNAYTKRDQLSFTYVLWKNGKGVDYVFSLGNNSRRNPYFIVDSHI